jgi:hypothetical protein
MKNYPIHENLDTCFVNLSALIKYLRRNRFTGTVRVEFGDYQGEIVLNEGDDDLITREHDLVSGRVGEGEEALQRLLIRSRQPGGIVNVYRRLAENPAVSYEKEKPAARNFSSDAPSAISVSEEKFSEQAAPARQIFAKTPTNSPAFPFQLSNNVETRAGSGALAPEDWQTLLDLTGALFGAIDKTLAAEGLNFRTAFEKASAEIAADYPFLDREKPVAHYADGAFTMNGQISAAIFVGGVLEILRRIMTKLGANPKFSEIYRRTVQEILALIRKNKLYDKFSITTPLEKIIGA